LCAQDYLVEAAIHNHFGLIGLIMAFLGFLSGTGLLGQRVSLPGLLVFRVAPFVFEKAPGGEIH
jgi:hypothetical protein